LSNEWDAREYECHGRFVAELATDVLALLAAKPGERILDLGCGDGVLTQRIQESGAEVLGIDASPDMVKAAVHRNVDARLGNGEHLSFHREFDAVFSNAALHWIKDQDALLSGVNRSLKPAGRFVAEMGGHGNIAAIRTALQSFFAPLGIDAEEHGGNRFYTPEEYSALLTRHQFDIKSIKWIGRPTYLKSGMEAWLRTFRKPLFQLLPESKRAEAVAQIANLLQPILCDRSGRWFADYVRLRFFAVAKE
jgi:trans-aconitate methyltransferase